MKSLYIVYDSVAETASPVFYESTEESATRTFAHLLAGVPYDPSNYDLYRLGGLELEPPTIIDMDKRHICNGLSVSHLIKEPKDNGQAQS